MQDVCYVTLCKGHSILQRIATHSLRTTALGGVLMLLLSGHSVIRKEI